jgi:hypothetical protein
MICLTQVLAEMGRVVRRSGSVYVAVPDSTTVSDRLYRWVYHGGGHVNPFRSPLDVTDQIRRHIPLPPAGYRVLRTSFGFLERSNFRPRPPRRMWLFCNGHYAAVTLLGYLARLMDRLFRTRLSVYGWALYYGAISEPVDTEVWSNVCVRCGSAQPARDLHPRMLVYTCPVCGAWNLFTRDA